MQDHPPGPVGATASDRRGRPRLRRALTGLRALAIGVLTAVAGALFTASPLGARVEEWAGLGLLFQLRGPRVPPADVVVVAIDAPSAAALGLPLSPVRWPRTRHAELIDALSRGGAAVIVFDIAFDEPGSPEGDWRLAEAVRRAGTVVLAQQLVRETAAAGDGRPVTGEVHVERLASPIPPLAEAAAGLAPFPLPRVPVQVSRYWAFKAGAGDAPSLPVVAFHLFAREAHDALLALLREAGARPADHVPAGAAVLPRARQAEQVIRALREAVERDPATAARLRAGLDRASRPPPGSRERRLLERLVRLYAGPAAPHVDFYGPARTIRTISYDRALAGDADVRGRAAFVGLSAHIGGEQRDGVHTVFSQPNGLDLSGVEVAASAFANLLEGRAVAPLSVGVQLAVVAGWGLALGLIAWHLPGIASAVLLPLLGVAYLVLAEQRFAATGRWLPLVAPLAVELPAAVGAAMAWRYRDARRERERLSTALAYYLPPRIAEELAREIGDVRASSQLVYGTCLSTDAHQYTTLAETMEPAALAELMNRYYSVLFAPVKRHGGLVQDVVGDSMLAVWATTAPDAGLRAQACQAALDIAAAVDRFNAASGRLALPTRIGLHSGRMLLGSVGAMDHYEYRAVGDIVNTATRLEGLNKYLGTRMLVSADALGGLEGFLTRELGSFVLAGKTRPVAVHELVAEGASATARQRELCAMFAAALAAYRRRDWAEAIRLWREIQDAHGGDDGPCQFYLRLCESYVAEPPDAGWDGHVRMDQK
jgi:adenylate cyclase